MSDKLEQRLIQVVAYDVNWPMQFKQEAQVVKEALGNNCIEIHHIGSTSVPGLAAKPVIDMIPVVSDLHHVDSANDSLLKLGYEAKGEFGIPFRRYFQKGGNERTHQLHVFEHDNPEIERHLKFRDWMRSHVEDREAYARLKQSLAEQFPYDINSYCLGKEEFIATIDRQAGFTGLRMVKALTTREWNAARHFRQFYFFDKAGLSDPYTWTFEHEAHVHFVLYQGAEIIGYTHLQLWPHHRAALRIVVIDETKRNCQYGRYFLGLCEKWLKCAGFRSLHIESSPSALAFYRKHGYIDMPFEDPDGYEGDPQDTAIGKIL
ncbi:glutamate rich protein GrpB [Legionella santicrucis]|uniref:Glutamate rich protein GrpB n=1 Tax=Legionella santicrucis TaxID=45074 RepID=A0A0W0YA42_9GAMM|nr:bifunctional GrpB family protein/GNAT family N-acetyltransferase [Legionella santicrucis]KTD53454.1 glutamate rich protein GrpB [Legionella santicrucis]